MRDRSSLSAPVSFIVQFVGRDFHQGRSAGAAPPHRRCALNTVIRSDWKCHSFAFRSSPMAQCLLTFIRKRASTPVPSKGPTIFTNPPSFHRFYCWISWLIYLLALRNNGGVLFIFLCENIRVILERVVFVIKEGRQEWKGRKEEREKELHQHVRKWRGEGESGENTNRTKRGRWKPSP